MKRISRSTYLPLLLLLVGIGFYVYYGVTWNAWHENIANLIIYVVIIVALFLSLRKKEELEQKRDDK